MPTVNVLFIHAYKSLSACFKSSDGSDLPTYQILSRPEPITRDEALGTPLGNKDNTNGYLGQPLNTIASALPAQPTKAYLEDGRFGSEQDLSPLDYDLRGADGTKK